MFRWLIRSSLKAFATPSKASAAVALRKFGRFTSALLEISQGALRKLQATAVAVWSAAIEAQRLPHSSGRWRPI